MLRPICCLVSSTFSANYHTDYASRSSNHSPLDVANRSKDNYHTYRDETGFDYDVVLARADLSKNINERHHLKVFLFPTTTPFHPHPN